MQSKLIDHAFILLTVAFTVFGQLMMKWRVEVLGPAPQSTNEKLAFFIGALTDVGVLTGLFAGLLAAIAWLVTLTKFPLSYAYPFMALNFVIVCAASRLLFDEPLNSTRIAGIGLIVLGTIFVGRS